MLRPKKKKSGISWKYSSVHCWWRSSLTTPLISQILCIKCLQFYSALKHGTIYYVSGVCCSQVRQTDAASVQIYFVCIHCGKTLQRDFKTGWNISLISVIKITDEADYCSHQWCWINEGWTKGILRTETKDSDCSCTPALQVTHFTLYQTLCSGQILIKPPQTFQKSCSHFVLMRERSCFFTASPCCVSLSVHVCMPTIKRLMCKSQDCKMPQKHTREAACKISNEAFYHIMLWLCVRSEPSISENPHSYFNLFILFYMILLRQRKTFAGFQDDLTSGTQRK